jgi:hypothetical protein
MGEDRVSKRVRGRLGTYLVVHPVDGGGGALRLLLEGAEARSGAGAGG